MKGWGKKLFIDLSREWLEAIKRFAQFLLLELPGLPSDSGSKVERLTYCEFRRSEIYLTGQCLWRIENGGIVEYNTLWI